MTPVAAMPQYPSEERRWGPPPKGMPTAACAGYNSDRLAYAQAQWRARRAREAGDNTTLLREVRIMAKLAIFLADAIVLWSLHPHPDTIRPALRAAS